LTKKAQRISLCNDGKNKNTFYCIKIMKLPKSKEGRYVVEAVAKALDVLDAFRDSEELTLTEISRRVGLNVSRTFRLLHTLAEYGYVEHSADGNRYLLGFKLFERAACLRKDLRQIALPFMHKLLSRFNETVNLGVLNKGEILYIEMLESSQPFRMAAAVGTRSPVHSTALGKVILAYLPQTQVKGLMASDRLVKLTERTITDPAKLNMQLQAVRRRGYAIDDQETELGAACIGAPVFDSTGKPVAAISISGPVSRILGPQKKEIASALIAACSEISKRLGLTGNRLAFKDELATSAIKIREGK
jgi:DNA-binding IclR family transcriptional regulator